MAEADRLAAALRYQQGMALPTPEPDSMVGRALDAAAQWGRGVQKNVSDLVSPTAWAEALKNPPRGVLSQMNPENKQEMIGQGIDAALDFGPGALGKVAPAMLGTFIGKNAKNWNISDALKAAEMEGAGVDPQIIWKETGTWKGPEGQWRQEISDKNAKITDEVFNQIKAKNKFKGPMIQALEHEELYKNYPQTGKPQTLMYADELPSGNILRGKTGTFQIPQITVAGPSTMAQRSVALHELQHAIQQKEGFARGGNINEFSSGPMFDKKARDLTADLSQVVTGGVNAKPIEVLQGIKYTDPNVIEPIIKKYGFKNIDEAKSFIYDENERRSPLGQYLRVAGEAEARATQARRNMTTEERRAKFPVESYDVPINQLIIRQ